MCLQIFCTECTNIRDIGTAYADKANKENLRDYLTEIILALKSKLIDHDTLTALQVCNYIAKAFDSNKNNEIADLLRQGISDSYEEKYDQAPQSFKLVLISLS